ncbi:MAG: sigma-70 family RNA polymerase sigma factor [Isosphaeraceae bacterium]
MPMIAKLGTSPDLRALFGTGTLVGLTDGQLLERFATRRDEGAERAFAALLDRHGPMVLRVCGGLLRDPNDADDAFQATFLVLARKARSLWVRDTIGPWLHGVAHRVATRALSDRARRRRHEHAAAMRAETAVLNPGPDPADDEILPILHAEIGRLPEPYRAAIVLCYFEGLTHDQAASRLGWPVGTVRSRLARGRDRLRRRLDERGLAPVSALALAAILPPAGRWGIPVAVRPSLAIATARVASQISAPTFTTAVGTSMAPAVFSLMKGVLRTMMLRTLIRTAATVAAAGLLATGAAALAFQGAGTTRRAATSAVAASPPRVALPDNPPKSEAEQIAEKFLKAGEKLFDAKDAAGLANTYSENGEILLIGEKDGEITEDIKAGRPEVEKFYTEVFKDKGTIDSENTIEFARLIAPDILVVHGRFRPNTGEAKLPFVQLRVKHGDKWLMSKLWLFLKHAE